MDLSDSVLGRSAAQYIRTRSEAALLRIGRDSFTRADLAKVACFNFNAAANLSAILNRELSVKDTSDVFERVAPRDLALPRLGAVAIAVLGAAFEAKRLGGNAPLQNWVKHHLEDDAKIVTFTSLKHRDVDAAADRKALKDRKATRRDQAHRTRVDRFTKRQSNGDKS